MLPDHLPFLLDHCLAGLYVLSGERIVWLNARAAELVGCKPEEMVGGSFLEFVYPPDLSLVRASADTATPYVIRVVRRDGELIHLEVHQRVVEKDGQRLISGAVVDVSSRVRTESVERDRLLHDAFHDSLTGLPNRALFLDRLEHRLALEKRRHKTSFCVLVLDIDRFKVINDSLGHVRGDELLIEVARRLQSCLRPADTVARLSGDEFTILLEDVPNASDARKVADRLQEELRVPFWLGTHEVFSGASIGIAHGSATYAHPEDILRDADTALYRAKAQGRGRCVEFDASMHDRAVELLQLETSLRRAVERNEFHLHYQPVVSLASGQIKGAEALLRWKHPERGLVPPMEFIPLAEETGLIVEIGAWVLREACRQMKEWQARLGQPDLEIGVNLSSRQFQGPGLVAAVAEVLRATGLSPRCLRLEVTESLLMDKHPNVAQTMTELRAMGVRIDLDDFGTGYSSLSYLHQFPIDTLKIDRSFIQRLGATDDAQEIVNTILALASSLDMEVVAEGVETEQQLEQLRKMRCAYAQGYHLSRPVEAVQFEALVGTRRSWAA
jgi:diguanylate cyclase (GGDEF)-like protein/PAS domain S-box-containing protein